MRTFLITGATGLIGRALTRHLLAQGARVLVLSRDAERAADLFGPHVRIVTDLNALESAHGIDIVVNLAGAAVLGDWWSGRRNRALLRSRLRVTRAVVALVRRAARPMTLLSASAVGYYGIGTAQCNEDGAPQRIFQSRLCQLWERAAMRASAQGTRVALLRLGVVFDRDGGAWPKLTLPYRFGFGLRWGDGRQWLSWIHRKDLLRALDFILEQSITGPINLTAPAPLPQRSFDATLCRYTGSRFRLVIPARWVRRALGERAQVFLDGQRAFPKRLLAAGFRFEYPSFVPAMRALLPVPGAADTGRATAFFNGACPICNAELGHYRRAAARTGAPVDFVDLRNYAESLQHYGIDAATARRRLFLRTQAGELVSGIDAFIEIWRRLPGYRMLARAAGAPVLHGLLSEIYDRALAPLVAWQGRRHEAARSRH